MYPLVLPAWSFGKKSQHAHTPSIPFLFWGGASLLLNAIFTTIDPKWFDTWAKAQNVDSWITNSYNKSTYNICITTAVCSSFFLKQTLSGIQSMGCNTKVYYTYAVVESQFRIACVKHLKFVGNFASFLLKFSYNV